MKINLKTLLKKCDGREECNSCKHFNNRRCVYRIVILDIDSNSAFLKCTYLKLLKKNKNKNIVILDIIKCEHSFTCRVCHFQKKYGYFEYCEKHNISYFQHSAFKYKAICCHCYGELTKQLKTDKLFTVIKEKGGEANGNGNGNGS